MASLGHPEHF
jgi:hypothetical protein